MAKKIIKEETLAPSESDIKAINTEDITPANEPGFEEVTDKTEATNDVVGPDGEGTRAVDTTVDGTIDSTDVEKTLAEKQKEALAQTEADQKKLEADTLETKQAETKAFEEDRIKAEEDFAKKTAELEKSAQAELDKIDKETIKESEQRTERDTLALEKKKTSELSYLRTQQEAQRVTNENAITTAKMNVDIQRQQSAWAYQKLGLGFSSGIINQSQQIATNGILKIAEIKAKMSLDEATSAVKIAETEFNYTSLVNGVIDKYSDKIDDTRKEMKARINTTKKSLLTSTFDKKKNIDEIKKWARDEKRKLEKEHIEEMRTVQDRGIELSKEIEATETNRINVGKTNINDRISDGSLYGMSDIELNKLATDAGISLNEIQSLKDTSIASSVGNVATTMLGDDYILSEAQRTEINDSVNSLLAQGKTLQEATETSTRATLEKTPEFKTKKELEELEAKSAKVKYQADLQKYYAGGTSGYIPKGTDMQEIIQPDGSVVIYNRVTRDVFELSKDKKELTHVSSIGDPSFITTKVPLKSQQSKTTREDSGEEELDEFGLPKKD